MAWKIDPAHSKVFFSARHMVIATVRGEFTKFDVDFQFDENNPAASKVEAKIDVASLTSGVADRDNHLRSGDFLDVEHYPYITFKSKKVDVVDANHGRITGDLTIRDTTREVVLDVEYSGLLKSPWGTTVAGFSAQTKINRKNWNLVWNVVVEGGALLVGEEVTINIDAEFVKVEQSVEAAVKTA